MLPKVRGYIIVEYYSIFVILQIKDQRKVKYTYLHIPNMYCDDK